MSEPMAVVILTITAWLVVFLYVLLAAIVAVIGVGWLVVAATWCGRRLKQFWEWWQRTYNDEVWRERHRIEEEARRYGAVQLPVWPDSRETSRSS